ncbi:MAG: hypothetical protein ACHQRM_07880 [Bacteroidia bacterium]
MLTRRFLLSWMLSSVLMWGLSYVWHGIFLNDIANLSYPKGIYLVASTVVYLAIGMVLTKLYTLQFVIHTLQNFFIRGIVCGAVTGLLFYMFALVIGVSFSKHISLGDMAIDIPWQLFEQIFGGIIIALVFVIIYEPIPRNRSEDIV